MAFGGHSDPGNEGIHSCIHIAVMRRPTRGTLPLPTDKPA